MARLFYQVILLKTTTFEPTGEAHRTFLMRYAAPGEDSWSEMAVRVAQFVQPNSPSEAYDAMRCARFVPAGRTLHGAGRPDWKGNLMNCFIFQPEDDVASIGDLHHDMYVTSCFGGGTGYNASKIRPRGSRIGSHPCAAPGVVSLALSIDGMLNQVRSGGSRRAAILGALTIRHPDVLEWIRVKQTLGILENHNISLYINDDFINAVRRDEDWEFAFNGTTWKTFEVAENEDKRFLVNALDEKHCGDILRNYYAKTGKENFRIVKELKVKAKWLFKKLVQSNLRCGEPGLLNESAILRDYAVDYVEPWVGNNPCTEAVTGHLGNCTLGSLDLSKYADHGDFDWEGFKQDVRAGVRFLDDVLDRTIYPLEGQRTAAMLTRRIGLGWMGYAHALIENALRYGGKDALEFTERLARTFRDTAFRASVELARERGPCPAVPGEADGGKTAYYLACDYQMRLPADIRRDIAKYGIRNSVILSIAPTGTISTVCGTSSSIEPVFAPAYVRRIRNGESYLAVTIIDPKFRELVLEGRDLSCFVDSYGVTPEEHMKTILAVQPFIDQSISKTINCPAGTDAEAFEAALLANLDGIKGVSIYSNGSRGDSPLMPYSFEEAMLLVKDDAATGMAEVECNTGSCEV